MALQQFGYVQSIPPLPTTPSLSIEEIGDKWLQFSQYLAPVGEFCSFPSQYAVGYLEWFYMISHPFMNLP